MGVWLVCGGFIMEDIDSHKDVFMKIEKIKIKNKQKTFTKKLKIMF